MDVTIRNLDREAYRRLKDRAKSEGISIGVALTQAIEYWLRQKNVRKRSASLMDMKPESFGKKNARLSEEMDEILYSR